MQNDEESLWMSIVALDYLPSPSAAIEGVKKSLISKYRKQWPNSKRGAQLLVRDASTAKASGALVSDLLSVATDDPLYADSQKQAVAHLYKLWLQAQAIQIFDIGNTYLRVAMPILISKMNAIDTGDTSQSESSAVLSLRILEIALHQQINRATAAQRALDALATIESDGKYSLQDFKKEIAYRTILLALANMETKKASLLLETFLASAPNDVWSLHAAKSVWRNWDLHQVETEPLLRFNVGSRILSGISDDTIVLEATLPISIGTAQAGLLLTNASDTLNTTEGVEALRIARLLLIEYPKTHRVLRLNASLEQLVGDTEIALIHWRTIAAGNPQGSDTWLVARLHIVKLLSKSNPQLARQLLDQHQILYPTYGSEPYGKQLKELHAMLKGGEDGS
jgi:hypothetical protein